MHKRGQIYFFIIAAIAASVVASCAGNSGITPTRLTTDSQEAGGSSAGPANAVDSQGQPAVQGDSTTPSPPTIWTGPGHISGLDDQFNPVDGNTGAYNGQPIDGVACQPTMSNNYHVHVFVGIYVNGVHYATPDTIGMYHPQPEPTNHFTIYAKCYYDIHTHDASGIVHVESPDPKHIPITGTEYQTKQLFDEWGIAVSRQNFGPFSGSLRVVTSGQVYRGGPGNGTIDRSTYRTWTGDPNQIPLYSHEAIFFEIGPKYPTVLPNVVYYTEF